ncbi:unnamed protein product [Allacma fusca]|uniref:Uncharacterized protein n=1 Tax=Allacma fusca TaxID=39272 RepID=A0A8J2KHZ6_9HEXA|nr:unnamed protein product [Allacma fusca]
MYSVLRKSAWSEIGFQIGISAKVAKDKYTYLGGNDSEDNASDTLIESQVLSTSDDEVLESNPLNSRESSAPAQSLKTTMRCKKRKINKQDKDVQNRILKVLE